MLDAATGEWAEPFVTLRQFPYDDDYWIPEQTCPIETADGATVVYTWAAPLSGFKLVERRPGAVAGDAGMTSASAAITYSKVWGRGIEDCRPFRFRLEGNKPVDIECLSGKDGLPEQGIVTTCPDCGGPMRIIAALTDPSSIRRCLHGMGLPARAPPVAPARPHPQAEFAYA